MRLRAGIAVAGAALLLAGVAGAGGTRPLVLGVSWEGTGQLAWLDARTLVPVGRRIDIGRPPTGLAARSPDGRTIALGSGSAVELKFVDVRAMRATGQLRLPGIGYVLDATWPALDRLIALRGGEEAAVFVVDPRSRRVLERRRLDGRLMSTVVAGRRLLALLAPSAAIGQARLAVVEANGSIRTVTLPGIAAGLTPAQDEQGTGQLASPGVAADPQGTRAAVVGLDTLLDVDLETLEIRLEHLPARVPARAAKRIEGWGRRLVWVRDDTVAVAGWNDSYEGDRRIHATTGVTLINLRTGTSRVLDETATGVERADDSLLAFGGTALRGYDLDGTLRFELLAGQDSGYVQTAGRYVYVGSDNSTRFVVVDVRAGRVLRTTRTPNPTIVLGP